VNKIHDPAVNVNLRRRRLRASLSSRNSVTRSLQINILLAGRLCLNLGRRIDRFENEMRAARNDLGCLREQITRIETLIDIIRSGLQLPRVAGGDRQPDSR